MGKCMSVVPKNKIKPLAVGITATGDKTKEGEEVTKDIVVLDEEAGAKDKSPSKDVSPTDNAGGKEGKKNKKKKKKEEDGKDGKEENGKAENSKGAKPKKEATKDRVVKKIEASRQGMVKRREENIHDKYAIGKVVGLGCFGEVRKIEDKDSGQMRCVKIMSKHLIPKSAQKRIDYEITLLISLDHPNIIKIFEYYETSTKIYIVQELCTGGELHDKIVARKKSQFEEHEIAALIQQLIQGINYLHKNYIVHRDINPENIIFSNNKDMKVKIVDFGTSQKFRHNQLMVQPYGTPYYMSPEVIKGCYSELCDIWSIGIIMHILLVGYPPFQEQDDRKLLAMICNCRMLNFEAHGWRKRSLGAIDLLKKLLTIDFRMRPSAEKAMHHEWLRSLGGFDAHVDDVKKALE